MTKILEEALWILQRDEVQKRTSLSKSGLYLKIREGNFPRPIRLGKRRVGWVAGEITDWLNHQIKESREGERHE